MTHDEIFSIGRYLSIFNDDNKIVYKPTIVFSYRPCDLALTSLTKIKNNNYLRPINTNLITQIVSGGESVGVILSGKYFKTRYYGNSININDLKNKFPFETPTIIQVSASCIAGLKYIINNQKLGLCFPEDLPHNDILQLASKYLGGYIEKIIDYKFSEKDLIID